MTRKELFDSHDELCLSALALMEKKNVDYASEADPFRNFRTFGLLGIVVRMSDKIARLHSLVERGLGNNAVKDESYRDTLLDLINYAVIFAGYAREELAASEIHDPLDEDHDGVPDPTCAECMGRVGPKGPGQFVIEPPKPPRYFGGLVSAMLAGSPGGPLDAL